MAEVKLHGFWPSPYSCRVIWALKLKGVEFEYIEEEIPNKSDLLLQYNPVYKEVPVLVHGGNPIAESLVILEYIEETWPANPLLPKDPYERAISRFWINYGVEMTPKLRAFFGASGEEEQEKAAKEVMEALKVVEEKSLGDNKFFGGDAINLVDISYGFFAHWFEAIEEVLGAKVIQPQTLPKFHDWVKNFKQVPVIRENLPDYDKLVAHMRGIKEQFDKNVGVDDQH